MRGRRLVALTVPLLVAVAAHAADPAQLSQRRDEALAAIDSNGDGNERVKAVGDLAALDDADAAKALAECVARLGARQTSLEAEHSRTLKEYQPFSGFTMTQKSDWTTKRQLLARLVIEDERQQSLGIVAQACVVAIRKMKDAGAIAALDKAAAAETDAHGRYLYVAGLLANPGAKPGNLARRALNDKAPLVRLGVYEGMAARRDPTLLELAGPGLKEPGWPLRQATLRAFEAMNDVRAVPHLVSAMQAEDGALVEDYARVLSGLTGQDLGRHPDAWAKWYEAHKDELAAKGARPVATGRSAARGPGEGFTYYGVQTLSRRVLFVIDISGSMKEEIGTARDTGVSRKDQLSGPKIEIAKRILLDAVHKLDPTTSFNVVYFNHGVQTFRDTMVLATPRAKADVELSLLDVKPAGATWAYGALRRAFEFGGVTDAPVTGGFDPQVDTIFFLSDGAPTDDSMDKAKPMEPETILAAVREWNRLAKIRVHSIAIDPRVGMGAMVRFMRGLAEETGGTYTEIGAR